MYPLSKIPHYIINPLKAVKITAFYKEESRELSAMHDIHTQMQIISPEKAQDHFYGQPQRQILSSMESINEAAIYRCSTKIEKSLLRPLRFLPSVLQGL